ncbi:MAG TPA: hypothetical protein VHA33_27825 [Candidatus Angelobacter sp.]|jgi:hypothetical protein|nr:hypothetical protein [Candidatus Angelobacter sp.]
MNRFNVALLPIDVIFQFLFVELASFFESSAEGYLLGENALAHVTLCQFRTANSEVARSVFNSWTSKRNIDLRMGQFHFRKGREAHAGMVWAEILVEKDPVLLSLQKDCFTHLARFGFEIFTGVETYSPHVTLALLRADSASIEPSIANLPYQTAIPFRPTVGYSTENGVFIKEI